MYIQAFGHHSFASQILLKVYYKTAIFWAEDAFLNKITKNI